jgi:hypothetical protein
MFLQKILRLPLRNAQNGGNETMAVKKKNSRRHARYIGLSPNEINRMAETRRRISLLLLLAEEQFGQTAALKNAGEFHFAQERGRRNVSSGANARCLRKFC